MNASIVFARWRQCAPLSNSVSLDRPVLLCKLVRYTPVAKRRIRSAAPDTYRHRASISMYSLVANISRSRYESPAIWTKWNGAPSRRVDFIADEGSLRQHA